MIRWVHETHLTNDGMIKVYLVFEDSSSKYPYFAFEILGRNRYVTSDWHLNDIINFPKSKIDNKDMRAVIKYTFDNPSFIKSLENK